MENIIKAMKLDFDLVKVYVKAICFTLLIPVVFAIINLKKMEWSAYMGYCLLQKKNLF